MSLSITITGGPPWGLRVNHDEELRPVVAKLIPAGRADCAGLRIGDLIEEVNEIPIGSTSQAHSLIQETKGELRLKVGRSREGYHATVAREKLSSSVNNSPVAERKLFGSPQPRTNPLFRQIRLDVEGIKGSADNKRRLFEQLSVTGGKPPPPATDRLLQRKIQMGFHAGVPSESTTGYGSVGGDFAGGASGRTSPLSSLMAEEDEEEDKTLHEEALRLHSSSAAARATEQEEKMSAQEMRIASPGPSQWALRTETHGAAPADGTIEVPRPRSVAALRQAITDKLEMKSPTGASQSEGGRRTPSSWANVRVFEGMDDDSSSTSKATFGRVLDGPVNPEKYFQGVPPPSYNWIPSSSSAHSPSKPPPPPSVPPKPPKPSVDLTTHDVDFNGNKRETTTRNSFLNSIAARTEGLTPSPVPSDDYGANSRSLYFENIYGRGMDESMTRSTTATTMSTTVEQEQHPAEESPVEPPEDPASSLPSNNHWPTLGSMDLESSQLLKSKSPSPYSSNTADHYATIRRAPTPVRLEAEEPQPARKQYSSSTTNDSGFGDALSPRDTLAFSDNYSVSSTMPASSADQTIDTLSIESSRPERPESLMSFSTVDGGNTEVEVPPLRPVSNEPEMTNWYRDMFKKMHRLEPTDSSGRHQALRESSPSATISRPLTPTTLVSRPPSRFECEITPRRARSVGRVVEPADRAAWERSRTAHFHLPSYAFKDEDPRALLCCCSSSRGCLRCGRPKKTPSWEEIDYLYRTLGKTTKKEEREEERLHSRIARRAISDRLDETARELEMFIMQLAEGAGGDRGRRRKDSDKEESAGLADEIAELKRLSKEEMMLRQKAERLQEELEEQRQRRHGYLPSAAPSLQKNMDRFEGLLNDYGGGKEASPSRNSPAGNVIRTATVVYKFIPKSPRELPLNKGDIVRINRQIDNNWLEGERNGRSGIFPSSYVQMNNESDPRLRMRAVYPFTARNSNEMSLKLGEVIIWRRDIDANWAEGANHIGEIGIFPKCYVRPDEEEQETPATVIPARPKTPKITFEFEQKEEEQWRPIPREQEIVHPVARAPAQEWQREPVMHQEITRESAPPRQQKSREELEQEKMREMVYQVHEMVRDPLSHQPTPSSHLHQMREITRETSSKHPAFCVDEPIPTSTQQNGYQMNISRAMARETEQEMNSYPNRNEEIRPNGIHEPSQPERPSTAWNGSSAASLANLIPKGSEVYRAVFAYHPEKEDELELNVDDIVFVVEKCDDGWFIGTSLRDGRFGTFPGNYVIRH